jgi:hypothetical protein
MRKATGLDLVLGMLSFVLIYILITHNSSITGFVIGPPVTLELVGPADNTEATQNSMTFIFQYPPDLEMKECSLILDDNVFKIITEFLSAYNSRIKADIKPGTHSWGIECTDTNNVTIQSLTRSLTIITPQEAVGMQKISGSTGYVYEFVLRDGLVLNIPDVRSGDALRAKRDQDTYLVTVLRIAQDYNRGLTFSELLITPGDKRIMLNPGGYTDIDFNNDDIQDMKLSLDAISYGRAVFTVAALKQEKKTTDEAPSQQSNATTPVSNADKTTGASLPKFNITIPKLEGNFLMLLALVATLIVLIVIVVLVKNKASKGKGYIEGIKEDALAVQEELMKGKKKKTRRKKKK